MFRDGNLHPLAFFTITNQVYEIQIQSDLFMQGYSYIEADYRPLPNFKMSKNFPKWCITLNFPIS